MGPWRWDEYKVQSGTLKMGRIYGTEWHLEDRINIGPEWDPEDGTNIRSRVGTWRWDKYGSRVGPWRWDEYKVPSEALQMGRIYGPEWDPEDGKNMGPERLVKNRRKTTLDSNRKVTTSYSLVRLLQKHSTQLSACEIRISESSIKHKHLHSISNRTPCQCKVTPLNCMRVLISSIA